MPLQAVKVADFGTGMAAALMAKFLAEAGAEVRRMEPPGGDPCANLYEAYPIWRSAQRDSSLFSPERERELIASSDICIVGGEAFTVDGVDRDLEAWAKINPRLIVVDIAASLSDSDFDPTHGADILVQARAGLVFETFPDRPALLGFMPSAYGAALHGLVAASAALYRRELGGSALISRVGLLESAMAWPLAFWGQAQNPTPRYTFRAPRGARALIFRTRDDAYVQLVLGSAGSKYQLYRTLGIDDPSIDPNDAGLPNANDGPDRYFGDVERIAPHVAERDSAELLTALSQAGVVCERVLPPGGNWGDEQVCQNEILERSPNGIVHVGQPVKWTLSAGIKKTAKNGAADDAPLRGIKVVDFGAFVAGPSLSVGLADLGAEVIKVEPPKGDPLRSIYRFYRSTNRGKRSIAIEMKSEDGLKLAHRLAREADIVCSNFRHGVAERLGIDATSLQAEQPGKIVVINAGYGVVGPRKSAPAFDPCIQAICGLEVRAGGAGNLPILNPMMMTDLCGGLLGQIGALMALYRRAKDGSGAAVAVPLLNAGLFLQSDIFRSDDGIIHGPASLLPDQTGYHPAEKLYRAADGWIAIAARSETDARALAQAFGIAAAHLRANWGVPEMRALDAAIGMQSVASALAILHDAGVPAEACRENVDSDFLNEDRHVAAGFVYETHSAEFGTVRGIGRPFLLQNCDILPDGTVSDKGEDGRSILADLGLSSAEIDDLFARGIVVGPKTAAA
ncbi:CoA transferase [uncultured Sphingobium sp.]|uniref:CoA transferase n=1 Tax=uncultured Sphingobium sp. TaxID=316087 RepID=UPI00259B5808|nr:CoA transferase [uncultured Sphingobium sp.]